MTILTYWLHRLLSREPSMRALRAVAANDKAITSKNNLTRAYKAAGEAVFNKENP